METKDKLKPTGIKRIWLAFSYSMDGFRSAWKSEAAFRQEAVLAAVLLSAVVFVGQNAIEYSLLVVFVWGAIILG